MVIDRQLHDEFFCRNPTPRRMRKRVARASTQNSGNAGFQAASSEISNPPCLMKGCDAIYPKHLLVSVKTVVKGTFGVERIVKRKAEPRAEII